MATIVCAIRGGEGSRAARELAIQRAKDQNAALLFLSIVDTSYLIQNESNLQPAMHAELRWLTHVLIRVAQQRASSAGIEAQTFVRDGVVETAIAEFVKEQKATELVLGAPRGTTANVFGDDAIEQFATRLKQQTDIDIEIARPEVVL